MSEKHRVRIGLERARASLDAAVQMISTDVEAALDDLLAARLLVSTALVQLGDESDEDGGERV